MHSKGTRVSVVNTAVAKMTVVRFNVCWKVGTAAPPAGEECYKGRLISLYHVKTLFDIFNSNVVSDWLDLFCHKIDFEMFPVLLNLVVGVKTHNSPAESR